MTTLEYLTATEVAKWMECSTAQLKAYRREGLGPRFERVGDRVLYPVAALKEWMNSCTDWMNS